MAEQSAVSADDFRAAFARIPSGVTVVTRRLSDGRPYGMTVSSFTSVSLNPMLILVCIDHAAAFLHNLEPQLAFAVNVLSDAQQHLSERFADRNEEDRFGGVDWTGGWNGVPLVSGAIASFICQLERTVEAGDHLILIGEVKHIETREGHALIWHQRGYASLRTRT